MIDTSEKFIQMMSKASEIQEMWVPCIYDWVYNSQTKQINSLTEYEATKMDLKGTGNSWLPDINQFYHIAHTIIGVGWTDFDYLCLNYYKLINEQIEKATFGQKHLEIGKEKIAIIFLMEKCFNKCWSAEGEWVSIAKVNIIH